MKNPQCLFIFLMLLSISSFAQKETNIWYFGKHAGLDFNQNPPTVLTNGALYQMEGSSSVCDQAGQLLFYTDGITVWNRNHVAMPNGTGLAGDYHSTNSGFIVKQPGNANIYFVITAGSVMSAHDLRYTVVDMSLNGALGGVTLKNVLLRANMTEKICAVPDHTNQNIWLVAHERNSTNYVKYLVSATGISSATIQSIGSVVNSEPGSLRFSHCGDKLANANPVTFILDLFDFDRSTGVISNAQQISFPAAVLWLEFSFYGDYLYVVIGHPSSLYQLTISSGLYSLLASPAVELGQMKLAPDGKIYIAEYYFPAPETYNPYNYIGVINNPELPGTACNYVQQGVFLNTNGNTQSMRGLPSFVSYMSWNPVDLGPDTTICAGSPITFHAGGGYNSYLWQNGSTDSAYTATAPGLYSVTVTDNCESYTDSVSLTFLPNSQAILGNDRAICPGDSIILDPGNAFLSYLWQDGSTDSTFTADLPGIFWCQVNTFCGVHSDTVIITQGLLPEVTLGPDTSICAGTQITFHAGGGYNSYLWQNGATDSAYTATVSGLYSVTVTDNCESYTDSVSLTILPNSQANLGNDRAICPGDSILLDPGDGFLNYVWQDGSTDSTYSADLPGIIWCQVTTLCGVLSDTVIITQGLLPEVTLGPDTSICAGTQITFHAGGGYNSYLWQNGSADSAYTATMSGLYSVTVTDNCESYTDSVSLTILPNSQANLGNDRVICPGDSVILDPGDGFLSYVWQDGSTDSAYSADVSGIFWCQVTTLCGVLSDTVIITQALQPDINLGPDTSICAGTQITFHAGGGYNSYLWQNGSTDSTFTADLPGIFWCQVNTFCGVHSDTVIITQGFLPDVTLGPDTSICAGTQITFHAGGGYNSYLWQNGSADSAYTATMSGLYSVTVTDNCESYTDSVSLTILPNSQANLGNDRAICPGDSIILDPGDGFLSYVWQDGSTDSTYSADASGIFWCQVTTLCGVLSDTVIITQALQPDINLGPDTSICAGTQITFHAGGGYNSYLWQNGSADSVFVATVAGLYAVTVTDYCGTDIDSVTIINIHPAPQPDLGNDSSFCTTVSMILDAGNGYSSYLWQNGTTNQTLPVNAPGTYSVSVTTSYGCLGSDSIIFMLNDVPAITLGEDVSLCDAAVFVFDPGSGFNSYLWQDGSTEQTFSTSSEGIYSVIVTNDCGAYTSSVTVGDCPHCICDIPNAFTPNSDGENDVLFVKGSGFTDLEFKIFNRLGEQVFFSNSIDYGWDGNWHGINQKNEVFIYTIKAHCLNGEKVFLKGNVTLLR